MLEAGVPEKAGEFALGPLPYVARIARRPAVAGCRKERPIWRRQHNGGGFIQGDAEFP